MNTFFRKSATYILGGLLLAFPAFTSAATLAAHVGETRLGVGDSFVVSLTLESESESINAIEGTLHFSNTTLALKEIRSGNSVVTLWVDPPKEVDGAIHFSGIIPGGYKGGERDVFMLVFEVQKAGAGSLTLSESRALLNDGNGTPRVLQFTPLTLTLAQKGSGVEAPEGMVSDTLAPEPFTPLLAKDPSLYDGQYFLAFAAQDKESGIQRYEVAETRLPFATGWQDAESPYLLLDQTRTSSVYIKAVDAAGNERIAVVHRDHLLRPYELLIGGILILLLAYIFVRRRRT